MVKVFMFLGVEADAETGEGSENEAKKLPVPFSSIVDLLLVAARADAGGR
jgi:hypothetical protein